MILVTPNIATLIFGVILLCSVLFAWRAKNFATFDRGTFHVFIAVLTGLGVFVTFIFYYNLVSLQQEQQVLSAYQTFAQINNTILTSLYDSIVRSSAVIPNFVLTLTPLSNTICPSEAPPDPVNPQTCTEKFILSSRIFSVWQDVVAARQFLTIIPTGYITNFLQRANSQQLYSQWTMSKISYSSRTQSFGDLLFEYGLPITNQVPESYVAATQALIADPRFQELLRPF